MDSNTRNADLLSEFLGDAGFSPVVVTELASLDRVLSSSPRIDVALVDIDRFTKPVWTRCEQLDDRGVPFIVLSGIRTQTLHTESRRHGARAFVEKPVTKRALLEWIDAALPDE